MKIIKPEVEYWLCPNDWQTQVARAARVCYGHDSGKRTAKEMCEMLEKNGHLSMFRHGTVYFVFTSEQIKSSVTIAKLLFSSYVGISYKRERKEKEKRTYFVAMNVQAYREMSPQVHNELEPCMVSLESRRNIQVRTKYRVEIFESIILQDTLFQKVLSSANLHYSLYLLYKE